MIIYVNRPFFSINKDNPAEVFYNTQQGNYKNILVQDYNNGFPELNDGDILYKYVTDSGIRGYIHNSKNIL